MVREEWTFLSNHGHALVCLADDPEIRLREVASQIGITERCAQRIVSDLEASGVIQRTRTGRRNTYVVRRDARFRHPLESDLTVGEFVDLIGRARSTSDGPSGVVPARPAASLRDDDTGTPTEPDRTQWQPASALALRTRVPRERSRSAAERHAEARRPRVARAVDERGAYVLDPRPGGTGRGGSPPSPTRYGVHGGSNAPSSHGS